MQGCTALSHGVGRTVPPRMNTPQASQWLDLARVPYLSDLHPISDLASLPIFPVDH